MVSSVVAPSPADSEVSNFLTALIGSSPNITAGANDSSFSQIIQLVNKTLDGVDSLEADALIAPVARTGPGSLLDQLAQVMSSSLINCTQLDRMMSVVARLLCVASVGVPPD